MGLLTDQIRGMMMSEGLGEEFTPPVVKTGIDILDYKNGKFSYDDFGAERIVTGIDVGKILMIVGESGTAKSTLAIQMGAHIAKQFGDLGTVQHQDFERATSDERVMNLLGIKNLRKLKELYIRPMKGINTESTFELIKNISRLKQQDSVKKKLDKKALKDFVNPFMVTNPWNAMEEMMVPTPIIIDSLAMMQPRDLEEGTEISGNAAAMQAAKKNASFFKGLIGEFIDGALVPIIINHINKKIKINQYDASPALLNYLGTDDTLPGLSSLSKKFKQIIKNILNWIW